MGQGYLRARLRSTADVAVLGSKVPRQVPTTSEVTSISLPHIHNLRFRNVLLCQSVTIIVALITSGV
jgi:hypothetical protein